jgi:hypothetical protein
MRTSKEVRDELEDVKNTVPHNSTTEDVLVGWREALEWVLSDYKGDENE